MKKLSILHTHKYIKLENNESKSYSFLSAPVLPDTRK